MSVVLQIVATFQPFTSLFHHEANAGTMTGASVTLKVANLCAVQFHNGHLDFFKIFYNSNVVLQNSTYL